ncbi:MAG TPA: hypothetical protein VKE40_27765 [Gemmataceae bacterium]|nr:hypothetical protein [Gemmataceae bacterium]
MIELLSKFEASELIGLVAVAGGLLCGIVGIIMGCWLEMRRAAIAGALKHDMLDRGMSADEIQTVISAGTGHGHGHGLRHSHRSCRM